MDDMQKLILNTFFLEHDEKKPLPKNDIWASCLEHAKKEYAAIAGRTIQDTLMDLYADYMAKYMKKNKILMNRSTIITSDSIDARKLFPAGKENKHNIPSFPAQETMHGFVDNVGWISAIPCFDKAVIRMNTFRYICYQMSETDTKNRSYILYLQDFIYAKGIYMPGISGIAKITFDNDEHANATFLKNTQMPSKDLYRNCRKEELRWTDSQYSLFADTIIQYADFLDKWLKSQKTDQISELTKIFIPTIIIINKTLYENKPKNPAKKYASDNSGCKTVAVKGCIQPEKITQIIGNHGLTVRSDRKPKIPKPRTVTEYKTAQWQTKGYIRTYKNGKTVHVKPSVHHRKLLYGTKQDSTAVQAVKFRKNSADSINSASIRKE